MTQQHFAYKSAEPERHKVKYSLVPTEVRPVGYRVLFKEEDTVKEQVVYFASKRMQTQASDVVAKLQGVTALRLVDVRYV